MAGLQGVGESSLVDRGIEYRFIPGDRQPWSVKRGISMGRVSLLAVLLSCASLGFGQTGLATVTGTVTDPSGAPVAGAPIIVHNLDNGSIFQGASSATGNFTVP
jgi:hypothetical protein